MSGMAPKSHSVQCSPVKCNEKPWDLWINEIGHASPLRDEDYQNSFADSNGKSGKSSVVLPSAYRRGSVNRLKHDMMSLFGQYPCLDTLSLAVCHMCGMSAKCSAVQRHLLEYHSSAEPILPPPSAPTVKLKAQSKSKHRKETFQTSEKPRIAQKDLKIFPEAEHAHSKPPAEMKISVDGNDLPVVSIQDNAELPLGDNLTDDIIEIMNSEGIQSVEDLPADPNAWKNIIKDFNSMQDIQESFGDGGAAYARPIIAPPVAKPARSKSTKSKSKHAMREYDPNKHCGVVVADTSKPCTRSLTCKAHALSLRRTVEGRTKPFDALLAEHRAAKDAPAAAVAPATTAVSISIPSPILTDRADIDLYSSLMTGETATLLTRALPHDQFILTDETAPAVPVLSIASPLSPPSNLPASSAKREEEDTSFPAIPSDICWYPTNPRPLAICTFNSCNMGSSIMIGKKLATVRNNFKTALARTHSNKIAPAPNAYYNNTISNTMASSKTKPQLRKLIMCPSFKNSNAKTDYSNFSTNQQNGHLFTSKRPILDEYEDAEPKHAKTNHRNSLKVAKPMMSQNDVLELSFMFDPLMADEKC